MNSGGFGRGAMNVLPGPAEQLLADHADMVDVILRQKGGPGRKEDGPTR